MNILFISPSNTIGGAEMSLVQMADFLQKRGNQVFVALPPATDTRYTDLLRPFVEGLFYVPLLPWNKLQTPFLQRLKGWMYRIYRSKGGWFFTVPGILRIIRQHRIDLVHTNTIMALDGAIAAKIAGVPHVQHLREITGYRSDALFPMIGQSYPKEFKKIMDWLHYALIANSKYVKNASVELYPAEKIQVVYNIFDINNAPPPKSLHPFNCNIGLVANVTAKWKNHQLLIELANEIKNENSYLHITYSFYGKIPKAGDAYLEELQALINKYNLGNVIFFKGLYYDQKVMYDEIDILFHTTPREYFGRIFIEAMSYSVPVVAIRGGGADELIQDGETGFLFEQGDITTAVQQILRLCQDPALYARITNEGRAFARQFRGEVVGQHLIDLYQRLLTT